jgi:hypothetical protein
MTNQEWNRLYEIYELMCSGRVFMAREELEYLLGINTKERA